MTPKESAGPSHERRRSEQAFRAAQKVMPGGVSSPVRAFGSVGGTPVFMKAGYGAEVTDIDGNRYIDMLSSWGPLILGHADPKVMRALYAGFGGTSFGAPTPNETRLAKMLIDALPAVEMVRFVSSGTEATMSALRLARAATGRDKILKFAGCYHGHVDCPAGAGRLRGRNPRPAGLPRRDQRAPRPTPSWSPTTPSTACRRHSPPTGGQIAAVIVEPVAANMGVVPPAPGLPGGAEGITETNGALLIFDEVVTGFRVGYSGAQGMFDINPDLTILGKVIGGGLPIGAYGGRRELMSQIAPSGPVYQAGTLAGNPMSVAAGIGTIRGIQRFASDPGGADDPAGLYAHLDRVTGHLADGLEDAAQEVGPPDDHPASRVDVHSVLPGRPGDQPGRRQEIGHPKLRPLLPCDAGGGRLLAAFPVRGGISKRSSQR